MARRKAANFARPLGRTPLGQEDSNGVLNTLTSDMSSVVVSSESVVHGSPNEWCSTLFTRLPLVSHRTEVVFFFPLLLGQVSTPFSPFHPLFVTHS